MKAPLTERRGFLEGRAPSRPGWMGRNWIKGEEGRAPHKGKGPGVCTEVTVGPRGGQSRMGLRVLADLGVMAAKGLVEWQLLHHSTHQIRPRHKWG